MFVKAVSSEEVTDNSLRMKMSLNSADDKLIEDCLYHNLYHFSQGKMSNEKLSTLFLGNVHTHLCSSSLAS